jgi:hypothetical protein
MIQPAEDLLVLEVFGEVRGGGQVEDNMLVAPGPLGPLGAGWGWKVMPLQSRGERVGNTWTLGEMDGKWMRNG